MGQRLEIVLEKTFGRELRADERTRLAEWPDKVLEPLVAFYAAPAGDDARRYRRRSLDALLEHLIEERDRAVAWLGTEAGKEFRRRAWTPEQREAWAERLCALPEDLLPREWPILWERCMETPVPAWPDVGPRSRQTFLAVLAMDGMITRSAAEANQPLARGIVQKWLDQQAGKEDA